MKKIPTLFRRDPNDLAHVLPEVTPGCEWVIAGEGVPTRKYDGTCVMLDAAGTWWARREVKPGKPAPAGFVPVETDETTGKTVGWVLAQDSSHAKYLHEVLTVGVVDTDDLTPGTYELCGPKVNGNPEGFTHHVVIPHAEAERLDGAPRDYAQLAGYVQGRGYEGIVWHHPDGRMAKLKARDFR